MYLKWKTKLTKKKGTYRTTPLELLTLRLDFVHTLKLTPRFPHRDSNIICI